SAHVAEPATTRSVPATLRALRCSGATRLGANFPTIHMPATVNSGEVDNTALKRDTSHRLRPSAKAPYAASVLMQQNPSIQYCSLVRCRTSPGAATGKRRTPEPT